ncbi:MAG: DUF29 domain-containing protein [Gomphosphaeria aponina SAG 52.96 = DSM 107014]|uniref:DUF29 domain-containing protein n=1 Tax=Gomphosphaeria aponina SAG 52.96 = DSM 107014 TaxID=1521640 RepID=A0A941GMM2_9CHRO|nr:DUF29 domain-containing protein [Gomphosphaeria aponina SAG 52.96 = DSM 107014]
MVTQLKQTNKNLYDTDYNLWVIETVKQLENQDFNSLDLENLIEEVSDLSRREKRRLESLLTQLFEHLLKLKYWESEKDYNRNHWKREIQNFRLQINKDLKASPSLKNHMRNILNECYRDGKKLAALASSIPLHTFPENPIATIEQVLDENWLP